MKIHEITENILPESGKASRKLCLSKKPDNKLGNSQLSSCIAQGLRKHKTEKSFTINGKRQPIKGRKIKGKKYGGPLPDYSKPH